MYFVIMGISVVALGGLSKIIFNKRFKIVPFLAIIVGFIVLGWILYNTTFYESSNSILINTSSVQDGEKFILDIHNRKLNSGFVSSRFLTGLTLKEIYQQIIKEYPQDIITYEGENLKIIHENQVILLKKVKSDSFLWKKRNTYDLNLEYILVETSSNKYIDIPFPEEYLIDKKDYSDVINIDCDIEELKKFYTGFTNVVINDDSIILNMEQTFVLRIENGKLYIND